MDEQDRDYRNLRERRRGIGGWKIAVVVGFLVMVVAAALYFLDGPGDRPPSGTPQEDAPSAPEAKVVPAPPEDSKPTPASPGEDSAEVTEGINQVTVRPDGTGLVAGLAPPGSTVVVKSGDRLIGTTRATSQGGWVVVFDPPLEPGDHLPHVEITTPDGETRVGVLAAVVKLTGRDETPFVALVPHTAEAAEQGARPEVVQSPDSGLGQQSLGEAGPPAVNIRSIQSLQQGTRIQVAGEARGGVSVTLAVGGETSPPVAVAEGSYVAVADFDPDAGKIRIKVTLMDQDGKAVASARVGLTGSRIGNLGDNSLVVVQKGDALWRIAHREYNGKGWLYTNIFTQNSAQIEDEDLIYPDQIFVVPKL